MATVTNSNLIDILKTRTHAGFYNQSFFAGRNSNYATYVPVSGNTITVPVENALGTASTVAEGATISGGTAFNPGTQAIALAKMGAADSLTREALSDVNNGDSLAGLVSQRLGQNLADGFDTAILSELASTTNNDGESTAEAIKLDDFFTAAENLKTANARRMIGFVSPKQAHQLYSNLTGTSGSSWPALGTDVAVNGSLGRIAGIDLFESNLIQSDSAIVFDPSALYIGIKDGVVVEADYAESNQTTTYYASVRFKGEIVRANGVRKIITT